MDYRDSHGVRRAKQFTRKSDADAYRGRIERELDDGTHLPPSDTPSAADAAQLWLEAGKLRHWKTSTAKQMRQRVDHISRRAIGREKLSKLTHQSVERFAIQLAETGTSRVSGGR